MRFKVDDIVYHINTKRFGKIVSWRSNGFFEYIYLIKYYDGVLDRISGSSKNYMTLPEYQIMMRNEKIDSLLNV